MTHYRIENIFKNKTIISEYWDDLVIKSFTVHAQYTGGDVLSFIDMHSHFCSVYFENLQLFLERTQFFKEGGIIL